MSARKQTSGKGKGTQKDEAGKESAAKAEGLPEVWPGNQGAERIAEIAECAKEQAVDEAWEKQIEEARKEAERAVTNPVPNEADLAQDPGDEEDEGYYCPNCGGPDGCDCGTDRYAGHPL